jgi:apolipoprotein D and lipocalin family protein
MRVFIAVFLLALAACTDTSPPRMTSIAGFEAGRLVGAWHVVDAFGTARPGLWRITPAEAGALALSSPAGTARIRDDGNGRLSVSGPPGDLRVLWADADDRTLVLARPGGGYAVVLTRTPAIAPDRLRAAREILAWNGVTP